MVCDLPHSCFDCPELRAYVEMTDKHQAGLFYCPIAIGEKAPAEAPKAVV